MGPVMCLFKQTNTLLRWNLYFFSMPIDSQYAFASCCWKVEHPIFQVATYPLWMLSLGSVQKWFGAAAPQRLVPPTSLAGAAGAAVGLGLNEGAAGWGLGGWGWNCCCWNCCWG